MNANEPVFLSCDCKSLLGDDPKTRMNFDRFGVTNGDFRAFEKKEREREGANMLANHGTLTYPGLSMKRARTVLGCAEVENLLDISQAPAPHAVDQDRAGRRQDGLICATALKALESC